MHKVPILGYRQPLHMYGFSHIFSRLWYRIIQQKIFEQVLTVFENTVFVLKNVL